MKGVEVREDLGKDGEASGVERRMQLFVARGAKFLVVFFCGE
jgi:hypothetical protein